MPLEIDICQLNWTTYEKGISANMLQKCVTNAAFTQKGLKTRSALQQCRTFYSTIITILLKCPKAVRISSTLKIETIGLQIDRQFEITLHLLNLNSSNINLLLASFFISNQSIKCNWV